MGSAPERKVTQIYIPRCTAQIALKKVVTTPDLDEAEPPRRLRGSEDFHKRHSGSASQAAQTRLFATMEGPDGVFVDTEG